MTEDDIRKMALDLDIDPNDLELIRETKFFNLRRDINLKKP
jgi:hypothetical protein